MKYIVIYAVGIVKMDDLEFVKMKEGQRSSVEIDQIPNMLRSGLDKSYLLLRSPSGKYFNVPGTINKYVTVNDAEINTDNNLHNLFKQAKIIFNE